MKMYLKGMFQEFMNIASLIIIYLKLYQQRYNVVLTLDF